MSGTTIHSSSAAPTSAGIPELPADLLATYDRLDALVSLDLGGRGVEHLYAAEHARTGLPLTGAAAELLAAVPEGGTVLLTTGSVSRAWISPTIGENDGPAGAAVLARALAIAKRATCVLVAEDTLLPALSAMLLSAGLTVLPLEKARQANRGGTLHAVAVASFPTTDEAAPAAATALLEELEPALLLSTERVGSNVNGIYYSMRGVDYGADRARVDVVFDLAAQRGLPRVAIGDGGNEIGMGNVAQAVEDHVKFGGEGDCACGAGIGATSTATALVTAACSNWGAYAVVAALAARLGDPRLLHTPAAEERLLQRGVDLGLINSVAGTIDARVDDLPVETHLAVVTLVQSIVASVLGRH